MPYFTEQETFYFFLLEFVCVFAMVSFLIIIPWEQLKIANIKNCMVSLVLFMIGCEETDPEKYLICAKGIKALQESLELCRQETLKTEKALFKLKKSNLGMFEEEKEEGLLSLVKTEAEKLQDAVMKKKLDITVSKGQLSGLREDLEINAVEQEVILADLKEENKKLKKSYEALKKHVLQSSFELV